MLFRRTSVSFGPRNRVACDHRQRDHDIVLHIVAKRKYGRFTVPSEISKPKVRSK